MNYKYSKKKKKLNGITIINADQDGIKHNNLYKIEPLDEIVLCGKEKDELICEKIDDIEIMTLEGNNNVIEPIDEIEIIGFERKENIYDPIDEIEIIGQPSTINIIEPVDEIEILGTIKKDYLYEPIDEIELIGIDISQFTISENTSFYIPPSNKNNFTLDNDGEDFDINSESDKYKEINELKEQLEKEKLKIKEIVKKIMELEEDLKDETKS